MGIIFVDVPDDKLPKMGLLRPNFRNVDWAVVGKTIREKRFQEVPQEIWELLADKLDPPKRGKGRPKNKEHDINSVEFWIAAEKAINNQNVLSRKRRNQAIYKTFKLLTTDGMKRVDAIESIENGFKHSDLTPNVGKKAIEKIIDGIEVQKKRIPPK